jgi:hypothetical protein
MKISMEELEAELDCQAGNDQTLESLSVRNPLQDAFEQFCKSYYFKPTEGKSLSSSSYLLLH